MKTTTTAKLLVAYSGMAWGVFWIPLHKLQQAGLSPVVAVIVFNFIPSLLVLPWAILRWRSFANGNYKHLMAAGLAMGTTQVFYALSVLNTDVVRAITLFYLNPVWTALLARALLGERLGKMGMLAMVLAFTGMGLVLHTGFSLPLPSNSGDWYAVIASFAWAASVIILRYQNEGNAVDLTIHALLWTALILVPVTLFANDSLSQTLAITSGVLWWLLPFIVLVLMTGVFASMWAVPKLSPNLVSLLYMTEISTAAISAAVLTDQPFTWKHGLGVALIAIAGAFAPLVTATQRLSASLRR